MFRDKETSPALEVFMMESVRVTEMHTCTWTYRLAGEGCVQGSRRKDGGSSAGDVSTHKEPS